MCDSSELADSAREAHGGGDLFYDAIGNLPEKHPPTSMAREGKLRYQLMPSTLLREDYCDSDCTDDSFHSIPLDEDDGYLCHVNYGEQLGSGLLEDTLEIGTEDDSSRCDTVADNTDGDSSKQTTVADDTSILTKGLGTVPSGTGSNSSTCATLLIDTVNECDSSLLCRNYLETCSAAAMVTESKLQEDKNGLSNKDVSEQVYDQEIVMDKEDIELTEDSVFIANSDSTIPCNSKTEDSNSVSDNLLDKILINTKTQICDNSNSEMSENPKISMDDTEKLVTKSSSTIDEHNNEDGIKENISSIPVTNEILAQTSSETKVTAPEKEEFEQGAETRQGDDASQGSNCDAEHPSVESTTSGTSKEHTVQNIDAVEQQQEDQQKEKKEDEDIFELESEVLGLDEEIEASLKHRDLEADDARLSVLTASAASTKQEGNRLFAAEQYTAAIKEYNKALALCPLDADKDRAIIYHNRAVAYHKMDNTEVALYSLGKAIACDPDYVKALVRRAQLHRDADRLDEALKDYEQVLKLQPSHSIAAIAAKELPGLIEQKNEKLKEEMMGKLKDLGNVVLKPFGLSTNNFAMQQDPSTGGYNIQFNPS